MASFREIFYKAKWRRFHPTAFANRLGGEVPVEFNRVSSIPHDRGKLRFVVREH